MLEHAIGFNHVATIPRHGGSGEHVALFEVGQGQRVAVKLSGLPVKGAPNVDGTPVIEGTPVWVFGHGAVLREGHRRIEGGDYREGISTIRGDDGFGVRATDGG